MKNRENLHNMTDEELAEELFDWFYAFYCVERSKEDLIEWLNDEAEE